MSWSLDTNPQLCIMESFKYYQDINDMCEELQIPRLRHPEFYIVKFEDYVQFTAENNDDTPFTHDYFEISMGEGHNVTVTINSNSQSFGERNLMFISPRQVVSWKHDYPQGATPPEYETTSYMILFKPEFLAFASDLFDVYKKFPFFNHNSKLAYTVPQELKTEFFAQIQEIYDQYKNETEDYLEFARAQLTLFLLKAKKSLKPHEDANIVKSRAHEITYNFENLIKRTADKRQPTAYYADLLHVSPVYLSECVKKVTNKTVKTIVDEYLILEMKSRLRKSDEPISQIATDLGFSDDSNFTKFFRAKTGSTPRSFRKAISA
ncbi:AraC family transcriptional regulator [bacterium SCSIO 12741]|nr:AraC family transcriptional regulator [bacterium SCSIO 12741]